MFLFSSRGLLCVDEGNAFASGRWKRRRDDGEEGFSGVCRCEDLRRLYVSGDRCRNECGKM